MNVLETFADVADVSKFPATPEEMHRLLEIEGQAKREHGLTHRGVNGYVYMAWEEQRVRSWV